MKKLEVPMKVVAVVLASPKANAYPIVKNPNAAPQASSKFLSIVLPEEKERETWGVRDSIIMTNTSLVQFHPSWLLNDDTSLQFHCSMRLSKR